MLEIRTTEGGQILGRVVAVCSLQAAPVGPAAALGVPQSPGLRGPSMNRARCEALAGLEAEGPQDTWVRLLPRDLAVFGTMQPARSQVLTLATQKPITGDVSQPRSAGVWAEPVQPVSQPQPKAAPSPGHVTPRV